MWGYLGLLCNHIAYCDAEHRVLACTVDSLARRVICRWRTITRTIDPELDLGAAADFKNICRVAAIVTARENVSGWLRVRYPVLVVDELQDCKGDHLCIIQAIESCCHVIAAADEFQDLQKTGPSAAVEWLHGCEGMKKFKSRSTTPRRGPVCCLLARTQHGVLTCVR